MKWPDVHVVADMEVDKVANMMADKKMAVCIGPNFDTTCVSSKICFVY